MSRIVHTFTEWNRPRRWRSELESVCLASGRLGVRIPAATDLSRDKNRLFKFFSAKCELNSSWHWSTLFRDTIHLPILDINPFLETNSLHYDCSLRMSQDFLFCKCFTLCPSLKTCPFHYENNIMFIDVQNKKVGFFFILKVAVRFCWIEMSFEIQSTYFKKLKL